MHERERERPTPTGLVRAVDPSRDPGVDAPEPASPVGVFRSTPSAGNVFVSDQLAAIFGVDATALLGRGWLELVHPEDRDRVLAALAARRDDDGVRLQYRVVRPDGEIRRVHVQVVSMQGADGERAHVGAVEDVTERLAVERTAQRLAAALEATPDLVSFHQLDGSAFYLNRAARDFFGVGEHGTPKPRDVRRYLELPPERADEIATAIFGPGLWAGELMICAPDGARRPASVVVIAHRDGDGEVEYFSAVTRDISDRVAAERARDESEARYRTIVDSQTELVCRYLPDTTLTFVNPAFVAFYGGVVEEWIGTKLIDIFPEVQREDELARLQEFSREHPVQSQQDWEPRHDGEIRWYEWTDTATFDVDGRPVEFQSVGRDIHDQLLAARRTEQQSHVLELIARGESLDATLHAIAELASAHDHHLMASVMMLTPDARHLTTVASHGLDRDFVAAIDGLPVGPRSAVCGKAAYFGTAVSVADVFDDEDLTPFRPLAEQHRVRAVWSTPLFTAGHAEVLGTLALYVDEVGEPTEAHRGLIEMMARLAEIAIERKRFEERLAHDSVHDPLTGLPNRTLFLDRLVQALGRARRTRTGVSVAFLDLDGFKVVNDSLGHDAGDELLVDVARRLAGATRPGDTVARFGGDEFVVLCEDLVTGDVPEQAMEIAQRLIDSLAQPFTVRGTETFVGASAGVAVARQGAERAEDLLRDADAAMYEAKALGKHRAVLFDDTLRDRALSQHATFNALHRAIDRDELRVFYQPIVSLTTGEVLGAEALVRWQHPERGLIPPSEFIPLAEQSELIEHLGSWVLERAVRFAAAQQPRHGTFSVSVNLAARQLTAGDLVERVARVLADSGLAPECLCLEITESVLMRDADATVGIIDALQALGVRVSIDDFGTGYSSLAYLKRFPVDSVKIDRSFVDGLPDDQGDRAIVAAVVSMAHALGLKVVAEGVEDDAQLAELVELGCDQGQGYFFAKPFLAAGLDEILTTTRAWRPPGVAGMRAVG